ncbi:hypothetical protein [Rhizobium sp. BK176]|uniref:hypothetical protein n=1 Tax=Rhizobium sp. BK176 TaxID=2587071 RepID=UPI00216709CE|nr:hypothetical protein [Rhizobium sp. BK176]MCS4089236.1 hypothetical protein [Rhizobium sp. BK176]
MTDKFISPTMDWIYDKDPNWASDTETLYKMGFSKKTLVDAHGYNVFGFNADGVDRLGCTEQDYQDPEILGIGKSSGQWMSLSQKLPLPLPRFLKLKTMFERLCRDKWEVEPDWFTGSVFPQDGRARLYAHLGTDYTVGLHWHDPEDRSDNYFTIKTDVVARLQANGGPDELHFRIVSRSLGSNHEIAEQNVCAPNLNAAQSVLANYVNKYLQPVHRWHLLIVDTPDGAALAAYSTAELDAAEGDRFGDPVVAVRREDALQAVMDSAKTSAVEAMASRGIQSLIGHPAVISSPKLR